MHLPTHKRQTTETIHSLKLNNSVNNPSDRTDEHHRKSQQICLTIVSDTSFYLRGFFLHVFLALPLRSIDQNLCNNFAFGLFVRLRADLEIFWHLFYKWHRFRLISHTLHTELCVNSKWFSVLVGASFKWAADTQFTCINFLTYTFANAIAAGMTTQQAMKWSHSMFCSWYSQVQLIIVSKSQPLLWLVFLLYFVNKFVIWISMNWLV